MKVAIPHWQGRVSPVLDSAERFLLVEADSDGPVRRQQVQLPSAGPMQRAAELADRRVNVVVCGAVSRPLAMAMRSAGLEVRANHCGPVEDVLAAFVEGRLGEADFAMPGCCGRRGGRRRGFGRGKSPGRPGRRNRIEP